MKVSIIIPVYNVEAYIKRCFDSVTAQTYRQIECILVDDCSPDNCNALLQKMISEYEGPVEFHLIRHELNKGLSVARNTGTEAASGDYIYYLDSDDEIRPEVIQDLVALAKKYLGVDMVQGNTQTIPHPEKKDDWRDISQKGYSEYFSDHKWIKQEILRARGIPVNAWNKLLRRDFLFDNQLFFKEGIIHEDAHWIFFVAKKIQTVAFSMNKGLIHYVTPGSIMQSRDDYKSLQCYLIIAREFSGHIDQVLFKEQLHHLWRLVYGCGRKIQRKEAHRELYVEFVELLKSIIAQKMYYGAWSLKCLLYILLIQKTLLRDNRAGWILVRLLNKMLSY